MNDVIAWMAVNWQYVLLAFYIVEKVVKLSPTKYDDIVLDIIWEALKKLVGKGGTDAPAAIPAQPKAAPKTNLDNIG